MRARAFIKAGDVDILAGHSIAQAWIEAFVTTFLFWNHKGQDTEQVVARTALSHDVDVLVLAECRIPRGVILRALNDEEALYRAPKQTNERFSIFTKFPGDYLEPLLDHPRMSIKRLRLPAKVEIVFATIHFFDRRNRTPAELHSLSGPVSRLLVEAERMAGHDRTILAGDFNMNPFEHGMIDPNGFGAMMTRGLARKHAEPGEAGPRFYNPMWGRFGDETAGPAGTFYHRHRAPLNPYWHTLDQVLVRPSLLDAFRDADLKVLTSVPSAEGEAALIAEGPKHWSIRISDHLPILFKLSLTGGMTHA